MDQCCFSQEYLHLKSYFDSVLENNVPFIGKLGINGLIGLGEHYRTSGLCVLLKTEIAILVGLEFFGT
jgi:hypothetical protein